MAIKSGVPTTVNGVLVGATDFSEFTIATGLPSGITAFGTGLPTSVGIFDTPLSPSFSDEGKYFEMSGQPGNTNWAFGLDAFFGIMEQGEILVRIYFNIGGVKNRCTLGPCMSISEVPGINGAQACVFDASVSPPESGGGVFLNGGDALVGTFDIQEGIQDPEWMWFRARKTNNLASPSEDDWQVTAWYGDIEDEPLAPDGIDPAPQNFTAPRGLFALGWAQAAFGSIFDQRIAFLSYSANPLVEPPPIPPLGAATIWTPFPAEGRSGAVGTLNGAIIGASDFSEFPVAIGLPAGITEFGISPTSPSFVAIEVDPVEGNYFQMALQGFKSWGFGLDSFFGQMLTGELLARVFLNIPVNGRKLLGPAANMSGLIGQDEGGADFDNWSGGFFRLDPDELSGVFSTSNGSSSNVITVDTQEPWQDGSWAWVRVRRVLNAILPATQDDWTITAWFGDLEDEPASPDGVNIGQVRGQTFLADAIGWAMPGNAGAETEQRIAFLSFTSDPLLAAPPTELLGTTWIDVPAVSPGTVWANIP